MRRLLVAGRRSEGLSGAVPLAAMAMAMAMGLLFLGCFDGSALDGYRCEGEADCLTLQACVEGFCVAAPIGTDAGGGTDGTVMGTDGTVVGTDSMVMGTDGTVMGTDSTVASCTPGASFCDADGQTLHVCNGSGTGPDPAQDTVCGFVCTVDQCRYASNVSDAVMAGCTSGAPPLTPPAGATVEWHTSGITCSPDCGDGTTTTIPSSATTPSWVCVSQLDIPSSVTFAADAADNLPSLVILVAGDADIDGTIDWDAAGRLGGPGASNGASDCGSASCDGDSGFGPGDGGGGGGDPTTNLCGGGGGAGYGGNGGDGGDGIGVGLGGAGGGTYGTSNLVPLLGGSGGGGGGANPIGSVHGSDGGGGGGALQITARGVIMGTGDIDARGGAGETTSTPDGAGGGGSGGAVLLEAPSITFTGTIRVHGLDGGDTPAATGGMGSWSGNEDGLNGMDSATGPGGGGGGGGGRVRLNENGGASCGPLTVWPSPACSTGSLRTTPGP